jgi:hypothetical protein
MSLHECHAAYHLWREIGRRMGIRDIPPSYAALEAFNIAYEREHFRYSDDNHRLAVASRDLMLGWLLPGRLKALGAPVIHAMLDQPMLTAVGLPTPPAPLRMALRAGMRARARLLRRLPPRRRPRLTTRVPNRTYPHGYRIEQLGADRP